MTATLEWALLAVGVGVGIANLAGVWGSIFGYASYYPLGDRGWQFYTFWGLSHLLNAMIAALGVLQYDTLGLPLWVSIAGGLLAVAGFAVAIAAAFDLGIEETEGMRGELRTDGWYRYTRNPQYIGYIPATVGAMLLADAPFVVVLCSFYLLWWVSFPLAEEPWLREQYGKEYDRYAQRVPRFVSLYTIRELSGRSTDSG